MSCAQATAEALYLDAQQRLIAAAVLDIAAGQITSISATLNPGKLAHLGRSPRRDFAAWLAR